MTDDPWLPTEVAPQGRREWARTLAQALGSVLGEEPSLSLLRVAPCAPGIVEACHQLLGRQQEIRVDAGGMVAGYVFGAAEQDPGFQAFLSVLGGHRVSALGLRQGLKSCDVEALLEGLLQHPSVLRGQGGLAEHLRARGVTTIHVWFVTVPFEGDTFPPEQVQAVRRVLLDSLAPPDTYSWGVAGWLHYVADLRRTGGLASALGLFGEESEPQGLGVLRHVLGMMSPDQFVSICRGLGTLPQRTPQLSEAFQRVVPDILPYAVAQLLARGHHWMLLHHPLEDLAGAFPGPLSALVKPLRQGLASIASDPLVGSFLDDLEWRSQNLTQQLERTESPDVFLALSPTAQFQLIEQATRAYRLEDMTRLLGHMEEALLGMHGARFEVLETLRLFLASGDQRKIPDYVFQTLETLFLQLYQETPDLEMKRKLKVVIPEYFRVRLKRGQALGLERTMRTLELAEGMPEDHGTEGLSVGWLRLTLESEESLDAALDCVFLGERALALNACAPFFACLGEPLYHRAAWRLGRESDRHQRERLLRVLIGAGPLVEEAILRMLRPLMPWYHARNLLLVLASVGSPRTVSHLPTFLEHADLRVRSVALRALRFCSQGRPPLPLLISRLEDPDEGVRQEAIAMLALQPGRDAVRALGSLAEDRKVPLETRIAAVRGLGLIRQPEATQILVNIASRPVHLFRRSDPESLRRAAAEALSRLPGASGGR